MEHIQPGEELRERDEGRWFDRDWILVVGSGKNLHHNEKSLEAFKQLLGIHLFLKDCLERSVLSVRNVILAKNVSHVYIFKFSSTHIFKKMKLIIIIYFI